MKLRDNFELHLKFLEADAREQAAELAKLPPLSPTTPGPKNRLGVVQNWLDVVQARVSILNETRSFLTWIDDSDEWKARLTDARDLLQSELYRLIGVQLTKD